MGMKKRRSEIGVYLGIYILFFIVLTQILSLRGSVIAIAETIVYIFLGIFGIFIFQKEIKRGLNEWKIKPLKSCLWLVGAFFADIILQNVALIPSILICPDYCSMVGESQADIVKLLPGFVLLLVFGILGPLTEEFVFRVFAVQVCGKKIPACLCVMLSSLAFMLLHMQMLTLPELLSNLSILTTGLVYGIVVYKTENATIPMALHILNNLLATIGLLMMK